MEKIGSFQGRSTFNTWLHRIAVNQALQQLRRGKVRNEGKNTTLEEWHHDLLIDPSLSPERELQVREFTERLATGIDQLSARHREVVLLRGVKGLDTAETAAALNISRTAVNLRLLRARKALREVLRAEQ